MQERKGNKSTVGVAYMNHWLMLTQSDAFTN